MVWATARNRVLAGWKLGAACRSGSICAVVRVVGGAPGAFETAGQFQGQGWDRGVVAVADPHHSSHRRTRCSKTRSRQQ